jgi:hypothetical protein
MVKDNKYTLAQIKKNLITFQKKLKHKNMDDNFWVIADRADFKPLQKIKKNSKTNSSISSKKIKVSKKTSKKTSNKISKKQSKKTFKLNQKANIHSIKEIKDNFLDGRGEYYKDKKFADIKIIINDKILDIIDDIKKYKDNKDDVILTVQITIYKVSSSGYLNFSDKSELKVKYTVDDFRNLNFKLKNIEVLMRLVSDSVIKTNSIAGISYKTLLEKINKKDIVDKIDNKIKNNKN